jgi:hypothetical protein
VSHISTNIYDIFLKSYKDLPKRRVGFMDVVKESVSRNKSPQPFLSGHRQILEKIRSIVHAYCERWSYV